MRLCRMEIADRRENNSQKSTSPNNQTLTRRKHHTSKTNAGTKSSTLSYLPSGPLSCGVIMHPDLSLFSRLQEENLNAGCRGKSGLRPTFVSMLPPSKPLFRVVGNLGTGARCRQLFSENLFYAGTTTSSGSLMSRRCTPRNPPRNADSFSGPSFGNIRYLAALENATFPQDRFVDNSCFPKQTAILYVPGPTLFSSRFAPITCGEASFSGPKV